MKPKNYFKGINSQYKKDKIMYQGRRKGLRKDLPKPTKNMFDVLEDDWLDKLWNKIKTLWK